MVDIDKEIERRQVMAQVNQERRHKVSPRYRDYLETVIEIHGTEAAFMNHPWREGS